MYLYEPRPKGGKWKTFFLIITTVILTVIVMNAVPVFWNQEKAQAEERGSQEQTLKLSEMQLASSLTSGDKKTKSSFVDIIQESMPSVVGVSVLRPNGDGILDLNMTQKWGIGTGVVLSKDGFILTNQHLASTLNGTVTVTLEDGVEVKGKTIWNEPNLDLAIVKIDSNSPLKEAKLGNAYNATIGEEVIAIGNPLGLEFQKSVTKGVISGLNRTLKVEDNNGTVVMENLIQTDASINTGNSGGPLINELGEVIGINTVKITSAEGIGFAVPIDIIKPILEKLNQTGTFSEGYLGMFAYDSEIVRYMNKNIGDIEGIYVATVNLGGPAYRAGVAVGDIITNVDNIAMNKMIELREYIYQKSPGDKITLKIVRKQEEKEIVVTLGKR